MFERYTERARRVIFFARYEASQLGDPYIEPQHLLLGLMREDPALFLNDLLQEGIEELRKSIEDDGHSRNQGRTLPANVDLPLSNPSKRVLAYGAEEAERAGTHHIGTEHLLLGILREQDGLAARLLEERGMSLGRIRGAAKSGGAAIQQRRTADDCIDFIDVESGARVGIMGMHWNYPLPRATDFVLLQPVASDRQVRYEVLEVIFDYVRQMPSQPYSIQHLKNITVKVRRAEHRVSGFSEST